MDGFSLLMMENIYIDVKRDGDTKDMVDVRSDCPWLVCICV